MSGVVGIQCDACDYARRVVVSAPSVTVGTVRDEARAFGWHRTRGEYVAVNGQTYGYTRDICEDCWKGGAR